MAFYCFGGEGPGKASDTLLLLPQQIVITFALTHHLGVSAS